MLLAATSAVVEAGEFGRQGQYFFPGPKSEGNEGQSIFDLDGGVIRSRRSLGGVGCHLKMPAADAYLNEAKHNAEQSMDAVAGALAEGIAPSAVGEALSLASNRLVLTQGKSRDGSRRVHGATPGVHASDAVNAWRNMILVSNPRNVVAGLLVSGYHVGQSKTHEQVSEYPHAEHLDEIKARLDETKENDAKRLLAEADEAIRANDQGRAAAAIQIHGERGYSARAVLDLMLGYAVSEDGRLHAEKYYRTVAEEYDTTRPAFRLRQLVALARVTASAYGYDASDNAGHRAGGYEEACRALRVEA